MPNPFKSKRSILWLGGVVVRILGVFPETNIQPEGFKSIAHLALRIGKPS